MLCLRDARRRRKKVRECAEHFGVTQQGWLRWEKKGTTWERMLAISDFLGVSLDQLAGREPMAQVADAGKGELK